MKIEGYQLEELSKKRLYINKYDMSLMYSYQLNVYWKEFFFDILNALKDKNVCEQEDLFTYMRNFYQQIIEENNLTIDFKDYITLNDYITLEEWLKDENNTIRYTDKEIFLERK